MPGQIASSTSLTRTHALSSGWEFAASAAGTPNDPGAAVGANLQWLPAVVPGTVAEALRALGLWSLDSPARRFDAEDFWYRVRFDNPFAASRCPITLHLDGLATIADVWLNGAHLLRSSSMFEAHMLSIKQPLRAQNELLIRFQALDSVLAQKRPRPRWRAPMISHQQLRYVRTTLLGRTPGWSPPAAAVGPWRAVRLEQQVECTLTNIRLRTRTSDAEGIVTLAADVSPSDDSDTQIVAAELVVNGEKEARIACAIKDGKITATLSVPDAKLWWPHTHGDPYLYSARIEFSTSSGNRFSTEITRVGFRNVRVVTVDESFAVWINGIKIFCRGACWTPLDVVTLSGTQTQYSHAIEQVRECGMNMLRVGGTMAYETDAFYDECDRQGVLIWQDFMFANMDYPESDAEFCQTVTQEVSQQLIRFASRPSITVLCGNSEVEQQAAMWGAARAQWEPRLFHSIIADLVRTNAPDIPYWPSSAHGGAFPHQPNVGTTSYYGVGAYLRPLDDARRSEVKFATECLAFANIPEDSDIEKMPNGFGLRVHHPEWKARTPRDLGAGWDFEDVRDYYLRHLYEIDPLQLRYGDHNRYLELSRVVTGEVLAATYSEWRRDRSACNGGLVWFLRDLWHGAGWGVVGADATPKAPYYYLRRVLQPLHLSLSDEGCNGLELHMTNESGEAIACTVALCLYRNGEHQVGQGTKSLSIASRTTQQFSALELFEGFSDLSYAYRFGPAAYDVAVATLNAPDGQLLAQSTYFPVKKLFTPAELGLTAIVTLANGPVEGAAASYKLTLRTQRFAHTVTVRAEGYDCEDQYFHLPPQRDCTLILRARAGGVAPPLRGFVHALNAIGPTKIELH